MIPPPFLIAAGQAIAKHWKLATGLIVVSGLVIALLLTRGTLAEVKGERDAEKAAHAETIANYRLAQEAAKALAERHRRDLEDLSRRNADEAEDRYAAGLADARTRADQFIAANRVRQVQCAGSPASGAATTAQGERPGVPAPMSAAPELVGVTPEDVRACAAAVEYGDRAHEWAMTLNPKP